jgi:hypothetical protein
MQEGDDNIVRIWEATQGRPATTREAELLAKYEVSVKAYTQGKLSGKELREFEIQLFDGPDAEFIGEVLELQFKLKDGLTEIARRRDNKDKPQG